MFWKTAVEPEPDTLRISDSGNISFGMPKRLQSGAKNVEIALSAPEADKSSIAVMSPISEGMISKAQLRPFMPPFVNWDHILTLLKMAVINMATMNSGIE